LLLLLLAYGGMVFVLGRYIATEHEAESLQRLSYGLAKHIVEHWPEVAREDRDASDRATREELLRMLMVVNPGIEVYMLDADGRISAYLGDPHAVRTRQIDLRPVRDFLGGSALPLRGTDPKTPGEAKIFSAAMFPPKTSDARPPGYLYVVLEGAERAQVAGDVSLRRAWQSAMIAAGVGLIATLLIGMAVFHKLTRPLHRLADRMRRYGVAAAEPDTRAIARSDRGDEVTAIAASFNHMVDRIEAQAVAQANQAAAHREVMANVAHDLRTPLTALHGHLESLCGEAEASGDARRKLHAAAALAQSDKVRRLSQQMFELATLQSTGYVLHRECFRLDELLTDVVQKFDLTPTGPRVVLDGTSPGPIAVEGDLQLIERALTNLIDNAIRHAPSAEPVRVGMLSEGSQVMAIVEDSGAGLPTELAQRLNSGHPVRDPPLERPGGGIGGLGLAIAQRVAALHGGSLRTGRSARGGTQLCLALPAQKPYESR
jgi:signal transduction histidine kinase